MWQEKAGKFVGDLYTVKGLILKCREHLNEEDVLHNKALVESLSRGGALTEQSLEVRTVAAERQALSFPLSLSQLLNALEVIMKLPPRFPVKLDIPVFPIIKATVTFQEFRFDKSIFTIPADYKEGPYR
uniref:Ankyrin repeat domain-containing protein n=1 Tax=Electrophorus electricus TaxID=8005 RepID=A0A4W4GTL7_ELEEL